MKRLANVVFFSTIFISMLVSAEGPSVEPASFPMPAQVRVEIAAYQADSDTYEVKDVKYWGQGPFFASPEELARSISSLNLARLRRNPRAVLGNEYVLDRPIQLYSEASMVKRKMAVSRTNGAGRRPAEVGR